MALSLRKAPKFRRKDYQRLRQKRSWNCDNEIISPENQVDSEFDTTNDTVFELSESSTRNRLHGKAGQNGDKPTKHQTDTQDFLTYKILAADTLQGIALKYGCSVSELKRINNLLQDQDAFALHEIRIPAREHSILFEIFSQQSSSCSSGGTENSKTFHVSINQMMQNNQEKKPSQFLKEMDKDIQRMVEKAQSQQTLDLEKCSINPTPIIRPLVKPYYDGANWGINWYCLLIVLLVVSVLAPVTYGIYFATVLHSHENNTSSQR